MPHDFDPERVELGEHRLSRIDRRMPIGPVRWPFHDLFWVHEGRVRMRFAEQGQTLTMSAPGGVLILPGTLFEGGPLDTRATASICHFTLPGPREAAGFRLPRLGEELHLQNLLRLALTLARRDSPDELPRRRRLLLALLDGFAAEGQRPPTAEDDRLSVAWRQAAQNLRRMRTLADVAALLGIGESAFRALHRKAWSTSAGDHLRELRLTRAEELLVTTDMPLHQIAREIGYGHAATLSAAFRERRGKTPGEYRHWSNPFA